MNKYYDFKCEGCGRVKEWFIHDSVKEVNCEWCGGTSYRLTPGPSGSGNAAHGFMSKQKSKHNMLDVNYEKVGSSLILNEEEK